METTVSRLDKAYRKILLSKFFTKGWGNPDDLIILYELRKYITDRKKCYSLVPQKYPIKILKKQLCKDCQLFEGEFESPLAMIAPQLFPKKVKTAYFQMVLPLYWTNKNKPMCIHLAGTGDHNFWRRRNLMAKPLLKFGIGSIILENPFYGLRKPDDQIRSNLHYVSDIFVMGGSLILESIALLNWCESNGFGPLGLTGVSMGGHMASLAACNYPKPVVLVPCLSWSTASSVFTEGVMSKSINWNMLQHQYFSDKIYSKLSEIHNIVDPFSIKLASIKNNSSKTNTYDLQDLFKILQSVVRKRQEFSNYKKRNKSYTKIHNEEAIKFMRSLMDEYTHLKNFSKPVDTSLILAVCANSDGYVPRCGVADLMDVWPGITIRYVNTGHVAACVLHRKVFQDCIVEAFHRAVQKISRHS